MTTLTPIAKNSVTLTPITKNSATLTPITKNTEISYLLTDNFEQILVGSAETDVLLLSGSVVANPYNKN